MILMGDEVGSTKHGNNNAYCHDNELNWLDWGLTERNGDLLRFFQRIIAFRRAHPALRSRHHFDRWEHHDGGYPPISWHGTRAWNADWQGRVLAFLLREPDAGGAADRDVFIYVAMNMYWDALPLELPRLPGGKTWRISTNTSMPAPEDIFAPGSEPALADQGSFLAGARSVAILVGS
jgi:glycogen operon protein